MAFAALGKDGLVGASLLAVVSYDYGTEGNTGGGRRNEGGTDSKGESRRSEKCRGEEEGGEFHFGFRSIC